MYETNVSFYARNAKSKVTHQKECYIECYSYMAMDRKVYEWHYLQKIIKTQNPKIVPLLGDTDRVSIVVSEGTFDYNGKTNTIYFTTYFATIDNR